MKAPEDLAAQTAEKTNDQLLEMLKQPDDWLPEALDVARAELQRRGIDSNTISVGTPPIPDGQPIFFPVSPLKLVVMSTVTFGIYELYWFYQNWKLVKHRTRRDIMPFWRAFLRVPLLLFYVQGDPDFSLRARSYSQIQPWLTHNTLDWSHRLLETA
jgi:hypothetical protein